MSHRPTPMTPRDPHQDFRQRPTTRPVWRLRLHSKLLVAVNATIARRVWPAGLSVGLINGGWRSGLARPSRRRWPRRPCPDRMPAVEVRIRASRPWTQCKAYIDRACAPDAGRGLRRDITSPCTARRYVFCKREPTAAPRRPSPERDASRGTWHLRSSARMVDGPPDSGRCSRSGATDAVVYVSEYH